MTMHEPPTANLRWGAATSVGKVRDSNEDCFVAQPMVFVVADGMGGHQAGEVASAIAASVMNDRLGNGALSADLVVAAVNEANAAIFHGAHSNPAQRGMGTTLTALVVLTPTDSAPALVVANVGDSRTYLLRDTSLSRVTIDHSYVQELVSTGHITEAEARNHPRRNIVTRALGIEPTVRVDTEVLPLVQGDRYVLCSDGLVDEADDTDIANIMAEHSDPQACAEALVQLANDKGGRDNTTVVVVDVLEGQQWAPHSDVVLEPVADISGEVARTATNPNTATNTAATNTDHTPSGRTVRPPLSARLRVTLLGLALAAVVAVVVVVFAVATSSSPTNTTTTTSTSTTSTSTPSTTSSTTTTVATSGT